ncbi:hypothetical protein DVH24_027747 [Malus domestica]|uniref:Uncharacterized protein n=1 Tax=Malus domestica TaxID=3750 RepID=A0A498H9V6_MALDO|nr:hypothetical protein DVH24_027747 [Malus domestica]
MANISIQVFAFAFFASLLITTSQSHGMPIKHVPLFILGDSIFDAGNNDYFNTTSKANFFPYGETFFNHSSTGRFSNGRLIPDFIAEYAKLPLIPPYLQPGNREFRYGVNFASAGAGALVEINQGLEWIFIQSAGTKLGTNKQNKLWAPTTPSRFVSMNSHENFSVDHPSWDCSRANLLNFGVPELEASELLKCLVIDLPSQLSNLESVRKSLRQELGHDEATTLLSRAVYLFAFGSNDYIVPFEKNSSVLHSYSPEKYVGLVIGNITSAIKEIYRNGGRNFGFLGMWPAACIPYGRALENKNGACFEEITPYVVLHDKALLKTLQKLENELKGFRYSLIEAYEFLKRRIDHPSKYGFVEGKAACCGSGPYRGHLSCGVKGGYSLCHNVSEYVFFDPFHPTERAYEQLAKQFWIGTPNSTVGGRKLHFGTLDLWAANLKSKQEILNWPNWVVTAEEQSTLARLHNRTLGAATAQQPLADQRHSATGAEDCLFLDDVLNNSAPRGINGGIT